MADKELDYKDIVFKGALILGGLLLLQAILDFSFHISLGL